MRKEDIKRLESFEVWIWRRTEKVGWTKEHKTNEEVLETIGRRKIPHMHNKIQTKEVDRTHS